MMVTPTAVPSSPKTVVIPIFLPMTPLGMAAPALPPASLRPPRPCAGGGGPRGPEVLLAGDGRPAGSGYLARARIRRNSYGHLGTSLPKRAVRVPRPQAPASALPVANQGTGFPS